MSELRSHDLLKELVALGVIGITVVNWLDIYDHFISECKDNQKAIAIQFTADYWSISERNLYRIISYFEN
jgi:hypothetical protein